MNQATFSPPQSGKMYPCPVPENPTAHADTTTASPGNMTPSMTTGIGNFTTN